MFMEKTISPVFMSVVEAMNYELPMNRAKHFGQMFIANYIDADKVSSRGDVYEYFEQVANYAKMQMQFYGESMTPEQKLLFKNMATAAQGVVWAVQHDGFDMVKYSPLDRWGSDISSLKGREFNV